MLQLNKLLYNYLIPFLELSFKIIKDKITVENAEFKSIIESIKAAEAKNKIKFKNLNDRALQAFKNSRTNEFVDIYYKNSLSVNEKITALTSLISENFEPEKFIAFRRTILDSDANRKDFIYLYDYAMFQSGIISPEEIFKTVEKGMAKQSPLAYVLKSLFYKDGLDTYESAKQAIERVILLEPGNLEYKSMLKELEREKI